MNAPPATQGVRAVSTSSMEDATGIVGTPLPPLSVRSNFRWTLAGNIVNALSQWGMIVVLARMGSEVIVGQFVLGLAIAAPIMAITMLQLRHIQVTDSAHEYEFADYFGLRIGWTIVGLLAIALWAWIGGYDAQTAWIIILVGLTKCIDSVSDIVRGLFQRVERMDYSAVSMMLRGPGALVALIALMWWSGSLALAVVAMAVVWLVIFMCYDALKAVRVLSTQTSSRQRFRPQLAWDVVVRLSWLALPLGIVMALISLQTNMPRYILEAYGGADALGYFGAMAYPMMAGLMVVGAMGQAASPRLAHNFRQDLPAYRRRLRKLLTLGLGLGVALVAGTILLGRPFLSLYGAQYAAYYEEFVVLAIAAAIQIIGSCLGYALTAARVFRTQVILTGGSCLAATVAGFLFIPQWGIMGGALTMLATAIAGTLLFAFTVISAIHNRSIENTAAAHSPQPDGGRRPIRVLHLQAKLDRGGAETWLMDIVRHSNRNELQIDACVTSEGRGAYEEDFKRLGGKILRCPLRRNPWAFSKRLEQMLVEESYDVIHTHLYYFSGFVLRAAARAGVPRRVAHNHPAEDVKAGGFLRVLYAWWMKRWTRRYGTAFVGPTRAALESFWGPSWEGDANKCVLYNGIHMDRFTRPENRAKIRIELSLPTDARVVLNVGRYVPHKRQGFLVEVAEQLLGSVENVYFVLIGAGELKAEVEAMVRDKKLEANFRFIEGAHSIDQFFLAADVFAFPSSNEGFGIVIAEAVAAGLSVIAQDIPGVREAASALPKVKLLPLDTNPQAWAEALKCALNEPRMSEPERQALLQRFPFTIDASINTLMKLYRD
jgi:O-antigen/teichoic acid export membrane protein/glycosyltransferase involved in cell wall biosynthesis